MCYIYSIVQDLLTIYVQDILIEAFYEKTYVVLIFLKKLIKSSLQPYSE